MPHEVRLWLFRWKDWRFFWKLTNLNGPMWKSLPDELHSIELFWLTRVNFVNKPGNFHHIQLFFQLSDLYRYVICMPDAPLLSFISVISAAVIICVNDYCNQEPKNINLLICFQWIKCYCFQISFPISSSFRSKITWN